MRLEIHYLFCQFEQFLLFLFLSLYLDNLYFFYSPVLCCVSSVVDLMSRLIWLWKFWSETSGKYMGPTTCYCCCYYYYYCIFIFDLTVYYLCSLSAITKDPDLVRRRRASQAISDEVNSCLIYCWVFLSRYVCFTHRLLCAS